MLEATNYLDPLWYYNLQNTPGKKFFPYYQNLSADEKKLIDFDLRYKQLSQVDASFQAFKRGIIPDSSSEKLVAENERSSFPVKDLYRFTAKYHHKGWLFFFWLIRIFSGANFFREIPFLLQSLKIKKVDLYHRVSHYPVDSISIPPDSNISVIIPTLNRYSFLKNILNDLSTQSILPAEILIIDQSDPADPAFYEAFKDLPLQVVFQKEKGQWKARNEAILSASGKYILLTDDDSRVKSDWIEKHLKVLLFFKGDISAGVSIAEGNKATTDKTFFHLAEEFDSGNAMVRREVFQQIGLFDRAFDGLRMGDTEFGLRAYLAGLKSVSNPLASRIHLKASQGGMRFWGSKKAFSPISFFGPRPDLGTLYLFSRYYTKKFLPAFVLPRILISYIPSGLKKTSVFGWMLGTIGFLVFSPVWSYKLFRNLRKVRRMESKIVFMDSLSNSTHSSKNFEKQI